ncbi:helix-turn-helix domain-containing protein [Schleiferilactobacillus harbinensis]|nr:helix-turn-helix domain-containing protein [Schleiferilactobacillus harbinensis]
MLTVIEKVNSKHLKMVLAENLQRLASQRHATVADVARDLNLADTTVRNWFTGKKYPRIDKIQALADYFHVSRSEITDSTPTNMERVSSVSRIPIIGEIACGNPIMAEENIDGYREVVSSYVPSGNVFFLKAKGESMEPTIPDGSYVMIQAQPDVEDGEIAAVLVDDDEEATLKRVRHQGKMVVLMPDNPAYKPIVLSREFPGRIIGKAVRVDFDL